MSIGQWLALIALFIAVVFSASSIVIEALKTKMVDLGDLFVTMLLAAFLVMLVNMSFNLNTHPLNITYKAPPVPDRWWRENLR